MVSARAATMSAQRAPALTSARLACLAGRGLVLRVVGWLGPIDRCECVTFVFLLGRTGTYSTMLAAQMYALLQPQLPTGSAIRRAVRAGTVTSCENSSFDLEQCICSALSEDDVAACHRLADEAFEAMPSSLTECETPCESPLVIALQVVRKAGALLQTQDESAATTLLQAELPTDGNWPVSYTHLTLPTILLV